MNERREKVGRGTERQRKGGGRERWRDEGEMRGREGDSGHTG